MSAPDERPEEGITLPPVPPRGVPPVPGAPTAAFPPPPAGGPAPERPRTSRRLALIAGITAAVLVIVGIAGVVVFRDRWSKPAAPVAASGTSTVMVTPTATVTVTATPSATGVENPNTSSGGASSTVQGQQFVGTWVGPVDQVGTGPYSARLSLEMVDGKLLGSSTYPELSNCKGNLINPRFDAGALYVDEVIIERRDRCLDTTLKLERDGDSLHYAFFSPSSGTATLSRQ